MVSPELLADVDSPIIVLHAQRTFEQLEEKEKLYAHFMSRAAFHGSRIIMRQVSPESEGIFDLLVGLYKACNGNWSDLSANTGMGDANGSILKCFLEYASMVMESLGNYRGYGDRKIIPRLTKPHFEKLCSISSELQTQFAALSQAIYDPEPSRLGYPDDRGMSAYYINSPKISKAEIRTIQDALLGNGIYVQNTRVRKLQDSDHGKQFEILIASVNNQPATNSKTVIELPNQTGSVNIIYGDYSSELARVCEMLHQAQKFASNELQRDYIVKTRESFLTGDINYHRAAAIDWLQNKSPAVETILGFIESYRDPSGNRCEWLGLVCFQNKEQTKAFDRAASHAMKYILCLPWAGTAAGLGSDDPGEFENPEFHRPDFVGLEILTLCAPNMWTGLSGPTYRDIKALHGRKSFTLMNRANATNPRATFPFVKPEDLEEYTRLRMISFNAILALHELFGHGCGKCLSESTAEDGTKQYNFNPNNPPKNPVTGDTVHTWYKGNEIPKTQFGGIYSGFNECLAESVGLFLLSEEEALQDLGVLTTNSDFTREDLVHNAYLLIVNMGIEGLLSYDPQPKKWNQAHARARWGIVRCLLGAGKDFLSIELTTTPAANLTIHLDRSKVESVGRNALAQLILYLHIYKATADVEGGTRLFENLTSVEGQFLQWREAMVLHQLTRPLYVQGNTILQGQTVSYKEYPATKEGLIQSWVERNL